jgi:hypothetical protein
MNTFKNGVNTLCQQITQILQLPKVTIQIKYMKCQLDDCLVVDMVDRQSLVYENPWETQRQQNKIVPLKKQIVVSLCYL